MPVRSMARFCGCRSNTPPSFGPRTKSLRKRCLLVALRGNHEIMMLRARDDRWLLLNWIACGGGTTLDSYGATAFPDDRWCLLEWIMGCELGLYGGHQEARHLATLRDIGADDKQAAYQYLMPQRCLKLQMYLTVSATMRPTHRRLARRRSDADSSTSQVAKYHSDRGYLCRDQCPFTGSAISSFTHRFRRDTPDTPISLAA